MSPHRQSSGGSAGKYQTPARRDQDAGAVVVRSVARGGVPVHYPQLTDTNYGVWAVKMKILLRSLGCWSAIEGKGNYDQARDEDAFTALSQSLPDAMVMAIAEDETAAQAWEAIRQMRVGEDRVKKSRVKQLKRQLDRLQMDEGETISAFGQKLMTLVAEIRNLGEKISDESVIEVLFNVVPERFADVVNTIEQWGDLSTMPVSEALGRLSSFENGQRGRRRNSTGKEDQLVLMTRALEQLMQVKKDSSGAGSSGSSRKKTSGKSDNPKNSKNSGGDRGKQKKKGKFDIAKVRCYNWNEKGHLQADCPEPSKRERANLAEQEDDEPAMLMVETCELIEQIDTPSEQVLLNEEKVVPKYKGPRDASWYLDTGASNHMTGDPEKFVELDQSIQGKVKFGDGSTVEICGRGSVLMKCLTGDHRVLSAVYYIP